MSSPTESTSPYLPHIPLANKWACWRPFVLRGTGFPFERLAPLEASHTLTALTQQQDAHTQHQRDCQALADAWDALPPGQTAGERKRQRKFHQRLQQGTLPTLSFALPPALQSLYETARTSRQALDDAIAHTEQTWSTEYPELCAYLQSQADDSLFRRALLWQNPSAVTETLNKAHTLSPTQTNRKARQVRQLIMRYLQRYCAKNDTIGFFGPVGWGTWNHREKALVQPGASLLASQTVSFEPWAIDAFAKEWSKDPAFLHDLAPRLHPHLEVHNDLLYGTANARRKDTSRTVTPQQLVWLKACDGRRSARELLASILAMPDHPFASDEEVVTTLFQLVAQGWILWELDLAWGTHVETRLLQHIDALQHPDQQADYKAQIAPLLDAKAQLIAAEAQADDALLEQAQLLLQQRFSEATGQSSSRNHGQTYGGRTLVYMDSRRDGTFELPTQWLEDISLPLQLILQSARWFTYTIAKAYHTQLHIWFDELANQLKLQEVPLLHLWRAALPWFSSVCPPPMAEAAHTLQERWRSILGTFDTNQSQVSFDPTSLQEAVLRQFAAPCPGWPSARHHAPDIMLAVDDLQTWQSGTHHFVLGEIHTGLHPMSTLTMSSQHPQLESLQALYQHDIPEPGIAPIPQVDFARSAHDSRLAARDFHLDTGAPWASWRDPASVLTLGQFVVSSQDGRLRATTRDGQHSFDIIQIFERKLKTMSAIHFSPFSSSGQTHMPRMALGSLIVSRESWRIDLKELTFASLPTPLSRFEAVQEWASTHELPRHLFLKSPREMKPLYIDRHSPHSVDMLCQLIHQAQSTAPDDVTETITLTEMLPAPSQLWLPDAEQRRYPSELRMIAVDPVAWSPKE